MKENFISLCINEAEKSTYKQRIGAVIYRRKTIISSAHNSVVKSRKKLHPKYQKWKNSVHAEIDAIISARADLKRSSMIVVRINNNGNLMLAKPCDHCMTYIRHVGIKEVIYSINNGFRRIKF
jgi:deoxycytidylate deaminase